MSTNVHIAAILQKLQEVNEELRDLASTSYSQSNPGRVLAMRSLQRQKARLEAQLIAEREKEKRD